MITYKFRIYPTKYQQDLLWWQATCLNRLYNYFLNIKINTYNDYNITLSKPDLDKILTSLKKYNPDLNNIHSQVLQSVTKRLDIAYKSFFNSNFGFPKYRSNKNFFGLLYPQGGYNILNNKINISKIGIIKCKFHRNIEGNIKQLFITKNNDNKWYVCITTDKELLCNDTNSSIGIDLGITKFATLNDGSYYPKLTHISYFDKQINNLKSKRDKSCKQHSKRWKYLSKTIKRLYVVKKRKINDFLHKVSRYLSNKYDTIFVEDLNIKSMSESDKVGLNREIRNTCWSRFINFLDYKTYELIKVNPYNTSKKCSQCGTLHNLSLRDRIMNCNICGLILDRDHNAAINIHCLGQAILNQR